MKTTWQFKFKLSIGSSKQGLLLFGLRRNGRGPWQRAEEVPENVREWFGLVEQPGAAHNWTIPEFKTLEDFRTRAHVKRLQRPKSKLYGKLYVQGFVEIESFPPPRDIPKLSCMSTHLDGSHWGLTDWYPEIESGIQEALRLGKSAVWTTGWYGSKKEIASACITHSDHKIRVEVSVSDDFDTEGLGERIIPHTVKLKKVQLAIDEAWNEAVENQKDNRCYVGFSILRKGKWVETLIMPTADGCLMESPPGDNYFQWGWQGEKRIPKEVKEKLYEWAETNDFGSFEYKG